jgi:hypothetical protein
MESSRTRRKVTDQDPSSASGELKLSFTRLWFLLGAETRETAAALYGDGFASLKCLIVNRVVAPFLFANPSPKSIINKAIIPL